MRVISGIKSENLLHTIPAVGGTFCTAICLFILFSAVCAAKTAPTTAYALLAKAQLLVEKASKTSGISAVALYDEPLRLLEEIVDKYPDAKEVNIEAEKLKALCHDRQARYAEKHQSLKRYADLSSGEDKEKAASIFKAEADVLLGAKETTEAVVLYRLVAREYPDTKAAPEGLYSVAQIQRAEDTARGATDVVTRGYRDVIEEYPTSGLAAKACIALADFQWEFRHKQEAIATLCELLDKQPNSEQSETALWQLGVWYLNLGNLARSKEMVEVYINKYPQGSNISKAQLLLQLVPELAGTRVN